MASQDRANAENALAQARYNNRNSADKIMEAVKGTPVQGSFKTGGRVPKDGAYQLHAGEQVTPAPEDQAGPDQSDDTRSDSTPDDDAVKGESVNLHRAFSKLHETVCLMLDELGIKRNATVPHVPGENMTQHMDAVGKVLPTVGGISANMITATHTEHSATGGETVLHPTDKLHKTIVPKTFAPAKAAIAACRSFVNKVDFLVGETPEVQLAKSQISMIGKQDMAGMTAFDAATALLSVPTPLIQLLARRHSEVKHGEQHPGLTAPQARHKIS